MKKTLMNRKRENSPCTETGFIRYTFITLRERGVHHANIS